MRCASWLRVLPAVYLLTSTNAAFVRAQEPDHQHHGHQESIEPPHEPHHAGYLAPALLGLYEMTREASGTSWQPGSAPHEALHTTAGAWWLMLHGFVMPAWTGQAGPRGDDDPYAASMVMGRATRAIGPGRLAFRTMLSLDPATIGSEGYPDLLQTGETSDGVTPLVDRQHPHDFFAELAASYAVSVGSGSIFLYGGLPGEPALGPPVYAHRLSGMDVPEAPISHHWLDSSHITFGVVTLGATWRDWKLEGSVFRGREPDHERWNIEEGELDSHSFRLSWNPTRDWAIQGSYGRLNEPEELHPGVDVDRTTLSAIYNRAAPGGNWQATLAWGRNRNRPGEILDAWLLESTRVVASRHSVLARAEIAEKDELFEEGDPRHGRVFRVGKVGLGYLYEAVRAGRLSLGLGAYEALSIVPDEIEPAYGKSLFSETVFLRLKVR